MLMQEQEKVVAISTAGTVAEPTLVRGKVVRTKWARNVLTFLMVFGPGLIVMEADNDAGAVSTYVQAGAQYGTKLLWVLLLLLPTCYFIQEMVVRLGIATGKGHAAMIYQRFGKWWGVFSLVDLELVNFLTLVTEFAAIALAVSHMGISPYLGVPVAAAGLVLMVLTGSYRRWERITVFFCLLDLVWLAIAIRLHPSVGQMAHDTLVPSIPVGWHHRQSYLPGDRDRGYDDCAVAAVLSAELHRRQASAVFGSEVGAPGHADRRDLHHHRRRLHDARRQCGVRPAESSSPIRRRWPTHFTCWREASGFVTHSCC